MGDDDKTYSGLLQVGAQIFFGPNADKAADYVVEQGVSGGWTYRKRPLEVGGQGNNLYYR